MCQRVRAAQGGETRFVIKVHKATIGCGYCLSRGSADWERRLAAVISYGESWNASCASFDPAFYDLFR